MKSNGHAGPACAGPLAAALNRGAARGGARPGGGDADPRGRRSRRADGGSLGPGGQPDRADGRPDRTGDPRPGRFCGRARPGKGRPLSAPAGRGRRGRDEDHARQAGDAVPRHREGLHLPPHAGGAGPRVGADPDPRSGGPDRGDRRGAASDARIGALAALVRAVARREPPPGTVIAAGGGAPGGGDGTIETWRGPRFTARVLEVGAVEFADAAELAAAAGPGVAAAWLSGPGTGPSGGRIAVTIHPSTIHAGARP